jgi:hypothetical protein
MAVTVLGALIVTPLVGWLAETLVDERAAHAAQREAMEERVRAALLARGMLPFTGAAAERTQRGGVELLHASETFSFDLAGGRLAGEPPSAAAAARAAGIVADELARYPVGFLPAHRLLRVVLCQRLTEAGMRIPSLPNVEQSLVLDVDAPPAFLRRLIHHEVFHFVDYTSDDQVKADPAWDALNERDFVYGFGGRFVRHGSASRFGSGGPGFVTEYAKSAIEEDKAETYAFLLTAPGSVQAAGGDDPTLRKKAEALFVFMEQRDPRVAQLLRGPR